MANQKLNKKTYKQHVALLFNTYMTVLGIYDPFETLPEEVTDKVTNQIDLAYTGNYTPQEAAFMLIIMLLSPILNDGTLINKEAIINGIQDLLIRTHECNDLSNRFILTMKEIGRYNAIFDCFEEQTIQ